MTERLIVLCDNVMTTTFINLFKHDVLMIQQLNVNLKSKIASRKHSVEVERLLMNPFGKSLNRLFGPFNNL